ncbi:MAG: type II secretion system protein [Deltaproteobacteria bacterium]|nr:type II secretion system protein [Deltaproteobacteria bacterium]TLN02215.1 MAG: type II secretion system protein [bacterium]
MRSLMYLIIAGCVTVTLIGCSAGRAFNAGQGLEDQGKYEEAMLSYADAFRANPEVVEYRARFLTARDRAAEIRYAKGLEEYRAGDYPAALKDFQVAYVLDPSKEIYRQKVDLTMRKRDAQEAYKEGLAFERDNKPKFAKLAFEKAIDLDPEESSYKQARDRVRGQLDTRVSGYELQLSSLKPFAFKFNGAGLKGVFRILTQLSGINFIFDEAVKDTPVTINLDRTNFRQVLDLLSTMHKLGSTVLNEKTVLIYPKTADKVKQYENMELHTFHLNYMDAKKGINLIRSMLPARKVYVNEETNSIVVRDNSETVGVIERLLDANDVPDAEVLLDVEVIELNDRNTRNVGLLLSRYGVDLGAFNLSSGQLLADTLVNVQTTGDTTTDASISNLINAFNWNGFGGFVTVPNATYNFGKTMAKGEVLSNPKIRVKNKEKAKFTVGTRVPITTTTTNGTIGGFSVNVQYVDVGVKLNAEPLIQLNNTIDIKLSLEVSSIVQRETLADKTTTVVTIGTRNLETVLSLKDGETSVIGGLISRTNTDSKNKIFLLGDIPVIGPFISGNSNSKEKTEIVLAITPHLMKGLIAPPANATSFMSGKEDDPSLALFPPASDEEPGAETFSRMPGQAAAAPRFTAPPAVPQPAIPPPAFVPQATPAPLPGQPGETPAATGQEVTPVAIPLSPGAVSNQAASPNSGSLIIATPPVSRVGETFTLEIRAENVGAVMSAPFSLTYDPNFVEPEAVSPGTFLQKQGLQTNFSSSTDPSGAINVDLSLPEGTAVEGGNGVLATAVFRAKKPGTAAFGFRDVAFKSATGANVPIIPVAASLNIQ